MDASSTEDGSYTIVVFGACNSGKTSLINTVTRTKRSVSEDGTPMTLKVEYVESGNKIYIDTPGLQKSPSKKLQIPSVDQYSPSFIWLLLNFQAAIEDEEFNILDSNREIPAIIILNKADMLKSETEAENFDKIEYPTSNQKLTALHQRLIEKKNSSSNIRHIVIVSLKDEDNDDRPPIGISFLQQLTDLELGNSKIKSTPPEPNGLESEESNITITVVGYNSTGKSSLVNAILQSGNVATVGTDNDLTTQQWIRYDKNQVHLWDSPAVNKRAVEQQQNIIPLDSKMQPDIIWWVVNYQSSSVDDELDLCQILQIDRNTPVIVIINKVDLLRKICNLSEADLVEFSHQPSGTPKFSTRKKLRDMIDSINDKWQNKVNVKAITVASLFDENADGEHCKVIGIDALLHITREHLKDDSKRFAFDVLKKTTEQHHEVQVYKKESRSLKQSFQNFIDAFRQWCSDIFQGATSG